MINILMTTMSLDIGGAETHIIELCKELIRRDCNIKITVASNGGVYVSDLEKAGIRHVTLPLHNKRLFSVLKSYFGLKKLLKNEKFDIVHAHARIPAFICGLVCKKVKFVTTAHGVYKINPIYRVLSNWGNRALAVSYDIKQYLIDQYKMSADNVIVTVNGIDTNRFSKNIDYSDIAEEFELKENSRRIIHVCRIDHESAYTALQLVEIAPTLFAVHDNIEIIIIGGGTAFLELKTQADNVNRLLGYKVIKLAGPRTDIHKFLAAGDIFIGVARSSVEAMSSEKPVILSGSPNYSEGYLGIFGADKLKNALDTNFTCRGFETSNTKQLYNDIMALFSLSAAERHAQGVYNRQIVLERYSIGKMADDALNLYRKLTPFEHYKYGDIIISGYYGYENMGDDSLLQQIINSIKTLEPNAKITALSKTPKKTSRIYGVNSIYRFNIFAIRKAMKNAKLLINGGGNLLQNKTSKRSLMYYIYIMKSAKKHGLKLMLYASGIGPLYGEKYKNITRDILNQADIITLREHLSVEEINTLGVENFNMSVTCDPAFYLDPAADNWIKYVMYREGLSLNKKYFMIAPRYIKDVHSSLPDDFDKRIAEACVQIERKYKITPVIIPLQPQNDSAICKKIAEYTGGKVISGLSASELAGLTKYMEFVASVRLHLLIYAISAGTPVLAIDCEPKITALFDRINLPYIIKAEQFTPGKFIDMAGALMNNSAKVRATLNDCVEELRQLSLKDAGYVVELLGDLTN